MWLYLYFSQGHQGCICVQLPQTEKSWMALPAVGYLHRLKYYLCILFIHCVLKHCSATLALDNTKSYSAQGKVEMYLMNLCITGIVSFCEKELTLPDAMLLLMKKVSAGLGKLTRLI